MDSSIPPKQHVPKNQYPNDMADTYQPCRGNMSLKDIFEDLKKISKIKKCSYCGCNKDTLNEFHKIATIKNEIELAENALKIAEKISNQKRYECIGCNPCYPADISNILFDIENSVPSKKEVTSNDQPCACDSSKKKNKWPAEIGTYYIGNKKNSIAINTLSNTTFPKQLIEKLKDKIAIVGYCETENIGIEKVVKNLISNPNIRTLIICGEESGNNMMGGHYAGQALISLYKNGINEQHRIIGAKGKRAVVKNLDKEQVKQFQLQIELITLIGNNSLETIGNIVDIEHSKKKKVFKKPLVQRIAKEVIIAENPQKLRLDKKGYFVIIPDKTQQKIFVEYYANTGELLQTMIGNDASSIYYTIIEKEFISKLDHCAYLGKELTRAEYFIKYDIPYRQDKALGQLAGEK